MVIGGYFGVGDLTVMAKITIAQAQAYASQAGFSSSKISSGINAGYSPQQIIVAIAQAESGLNTTSVNTQDPYHGSFGILQINGSHLKDFYATGTTTKACALQPLCAFQYAFQLSQHGSNFFDWGSYSTDGVHNNGPYKQYLAVAGTGTGVTAATSNTTIDQLFTNAKLTKWYNLWPGWQQYGQNGEEGQDYGIAIGTPIGAIYGGTVVYKYTYTNSIGNIVGLLTSDGVHHYQHLSETSLKVNDTVNAGDIIGASGGLPIDAYSTGPHIEVRWSATFNKPKGTAQAWEDPRQHFIDLSQTTVANAALSGLNLSSTGSGNAATGLFTTVVENVHLTPTSEVVDILNYIDYAMALTNPFDLSADSIDQINIFGANIPNPFTYLGDVMSHIFSDLIAIALRLILVILGLYICFNVFKTAISTGSDVVDNLHQTITS